MARKQKDLTVAEDAARSGLPVEEIIAIRQALVEAKAYAKAFDEVYAPDIEENSVPLTELADFVGMRRKTLRRLVRDGAVPAFKYKGRWRIWEKDWPIVNQYQARGFR